LAADRLIGWVAARPCGRGRKRSRNAPYFLLHTASPCGFTCAERSFTNRSRAMLFENAASPDSAARPSLRHSAESFQSTELAPLSPKQCTSGESSPIGSLTPSFWRRSLSGVTAALRTSPRQKSAELDEVASLSPKSIGANASIQPGAADALFVKTSLVMVPETLSGMWRASVALFLTRTAQATRTNNTARLCV